MKRVDSWVFVVIVLLVGLGSASGPAEEPRYLAPALVSDGWIQLFDGSTLYGWTATSDADWKANDGILSVGNGKPGFLRTNVEFADFQLHVEFQAPSATNSGVFLRTTTNPQDPLRDCYEVNIAPPENPFPTGSLVGRQRVSSITPSADDWHELDIVAEKGQIRIKLDRAEILRYHDPRPIPRGHIALQFNKGSIQYRSVRLRPLGYRPLATPGVAARGTLPGAGAGSYTRTTDGQLRITGGPGQLEFDGSYRDFVLRLECRTNARGLNSGVFFRCIPHDTLMGYESQIHNGFGSDRSHPTDAGTGGIFRRCNARWVVPDDQVWFHKTIVASGRQIAIWVNGYLVSTWTDDRAPDDNPRKGFREAAGTIMLQAHDPTTDVSFRDLQIAEY